MSVGMAGCCSGCFLETRLRAGGGKIRSREIGEEALVIWERGSGGRCGAGWESGVVR